MHARAYSMHARTRARSLTQTLCADDNNRSSSNRHIKVFSSGQSGYDTQTERSSSYERWMIYKLISHTNPIDQKHSFGSFSLQASYLNDMNKKDLAGSNGVEGEETEEKIEGKFYAAESDHNWLVVGMTNVKLHPSLKGWAPTTCQACVNKSKLRWSVCVHSYWPGPYGVGGWHEGALSAGFGDARWPDASGASGEGDAGGECDLPRSYPLSASFCSESAKKQR